MPLAFFLFLYIHTFLYGFYSHFSILSMFLFGYNTFVWLTRLLLWIPSSALGSPSNRLMFVTVL